MVYNPVFRELFVARKGKGAYLNGEAIRVSGIGDLKESLLTTGFPYDIATNPRNNIDNWVRFLLRGPGAEARRVGGAQSYYVACGRFDGFWELSLHPWDVAAGLLMVREAGGVVTAIEGEDTASIRRGPRLQRPDP